MTLNNNNIDPDKTAVESDDDLSLLTHPGESLTEEEIDAALKTIEDRSEFNNPPPSQLYTGVGSTTNLNTEAIERAYGVSNTSIAAPSADAAGRPEDLDANRSTMPAYTNPYTKLVVIVACAAALVGVGSIFVLPKNSEAPQPAPTEKPAEEKAEQPATTTDDGKLKADIALNDLNAKAKVPAEPKITVGGSSTLNDNPTVAGTPTKTFAP